MLEETIYWGDAILGQIGKCKLDGNEQTILVSDPDAYYFGLALGPDYLYVTDWNKR